MVSIDVETTGLNDRKDSIWEIACIPVNFNLEVDKTRPILDMVMCPEGLDDMDERCAGLSGVDRDYILANGIDPETGCDLFMGWVRKLGLGARKRIVPLAHNWKFDSGFIKAWLGRDTYDEIFDGRHRDTLQVACGINDAHELAGLEIPYAKQNLGYLCNCTGVKLERAHRALEDARATIELYKKLTIRIAAHL